MDVLNIEREMLIGCDCYIMVRGTAGGFPACRIYASLGFKRITRKGFQKARNRRLNEKSAVVSLFQRLSHYREWQRRFDNTQIYIYSDVQPTTFHC